MKKLFLNKYVRYSLLVLLGLFLGRLFFHPSTESVAKHEHEVSDFKGTIWTCSMHPQIRRTEPGKCPICGMDLIPLNQNVEKMDKDAVHISKDAVALANIQTSKVTAKNPVKEVRLYGKVQADERLLQSQVAHFPGRIEKLYVNFTGEKIRRGQTLATIYSPELITAQQELLEAMQTRQTQKEIYEAAKERLRQWMITDEQIEEIEKSGTVRNNFEVISNTTGIVISRRVNNGDHIAEGTILFDIADLSRVWIMFDAYENDLPFIKEGNEVTFILQALPGNKFSGKVTFIDPLIDPLTRVAKVRVDYNNESGVLKPEMFATGIITSKLPEYNGKIVIPASAVLWTGKRSIVYVKKTDSEEPVYKMREIELGPTLGNSYVVLNGLTEGEEIVTQGAFSVDAAAQLDGKPSMMNSGE